MTKPSHSIHQSEVGIFHASPITLSRTAKLSGPRNGRKNRLSVDGNRKRWLRGNTLRSLRRNLHFFGEFGTSSMGGSAVSANKAALEFGSSFILLTIVP